MIPYFDAHCDTIYRCLVTGDEVALEPGAEAEQRAYFAACRGLRENGGHIDLIRAKSFARYAQFFALYFDAHDAPEDGMWAQCQRLHDCFVRETEQNRDLICRCRSAKEIDCAVQSGKMAALLSIEGADLLECDIHRIETTADWGVRFLNPVWNRANPLSGTNCEDAERGLSAEGRAFLREMEHCGIYADVSHLSDAGFWDLVRAAKKPIVASHSNSRTLCPHRRNLTDDMFRAIRDSGGVVGINFYLDFVGGGAMDDLVRHVEHFLSLGGEKTVCLGGDFDGCDELAGGMQDICGVPALYDALKKRGYTEALLNDIFWNNLKRLL